MKDTEVHFKRMTRCLVCSDVDGTPCSALCISSTQKRCRFSFSEKLPASGCENSGSVAVKGHFLPLQDFRRHTEWQFKIKVKPKSNCIHWVKLHACFYSGCRMRHHSDSVGTRSQWTVTQPEELEEVPPVSWAGPASSPHCKLKLLVVLSECWSLASSAEEIPVDVFCLATEAAASKDRDAQLKGGHLLSCFSSPAPKCCEC